MLVIWYFYDHALFEVLIKINIGYFELCDLTLQNTTMNLHDIYFLVDNQ